MERDSAEAKLYVTELDAAANADKQKKQR